MPPLACPSPQMSAAFARVRDARICWLLDHHPLAAAMLVRIGWFPTKNTALRRLRRLVARRRIRLVGTVCRKPGRPEHVFCRTRPKSDSLLHEVDLTEICFRLDASKIVRAPQAVDTELRPDAEVWIQGRRHFLEMDRRTMGCAQIQRRFRHYEGTKDLVLWVCSTAERMEGFRQRAEQFARQDAAAVAFQLVELSAWIESARRPAHALRSDSAVRHAGRPVVLDALSNTT